MGVIGLLKIESGQRLVFSIAVSLILIILFYLMLMSSNDILIWAVIFYLLKFFLVIAPIYFVTKSASYWLHPLIFIGVWDLFLIVIPESSLIINGMDSHPGMPGEGVVSLNESVSIKFIMDSVFIIFTYTGFYLAQKVPVLPLRHGEPKSINFKLTLTAFVSIFGLYMLVKNVGSLQMLALQRGLDTDERVFAQIGGHWHFLSSIASPAALLAAALIKNPLRSPVFWMLCILAIVSKFIVTGSRGGTLAVPVLIFFMVAVRRNKINVRKILIFSFGVLVFIGLMSDFRSQSNKMVSINDYQSDYQISESILTAFEVLGKYSSKGNSDFPIYAFVPERSELLMGESYLSILAMPIPRFLWNDKPNGVGRLASEVFMPFKQGGVPPTAAGEAFWNFHLLGVLIIATMWGAFLRFIWKSVIRTKMPGYVALYLVTIYYLSPQTSSIYTWAHFFVPCLLLLLFITFVTFGASKQAVRH